MLEMELTDPIFFRKYEDDSVLGFRCKGILLNHNTLETFKNCDKKALLKIEAIKLYSDLLNQESIQSSSDLVKFCLLSFAVSAVYCSLISMCNKFNNELSTKPLLSLRI